MVRQTEREGRGREGLGEGEREMLLNYKEICFTYSTIKLVGNYQLLHYFPHLTSLCYKKAYLKVKIKNVFQNSSFRKTLKQRKLKINKTFHKPVWIFKYHNKKMRNNYVQSKYLGSNLLC